MAKNNSTPKLSQIPLPIEGETIEIPLTKGYAVIVDAIDANLMVHKWRAEIKHNRNYAVRSSKGKGVRMHRVICARSLGRELLPSEVVDHINGNGLDNRRVNLRACTGAQNAKNKKRPSNNTSGYKGVTLHKRSKKWQAQIALEGASNYLGSFDTPEQAYEAYKEAANSNYGEFARYE